ncbi:MAG: AMP-binding protein [Shinella sp.]|nr:AMP-binding protein [Shinella sp.]
MPLSAAISRHAVERPDFPAFRLEDRVFSYRELAGDAARLLACFRHLCGDKEGRSRIGPAHRLVAISTGNHALFAAAFVAATSAGHCAALIDPSQPEAVRARMIAALRPDLLVTAEGDGLSIADPYDATAETFHSQPPEGIAALPEGEASAPFMIVFTSGTTADPKPIIRDRRSWRVSLQAGAPLFDIDGESSTLSPGPLAHGLALYAMTETLLAGAQFAAAGRFDPVSALETIRRHSLSRLVLVPTMLRRLADAAGGGTFGAVRAITVAGAKLTAADRALAARVFPHAALREYYGASELGFVSVTAPGDPASPTAVGRAFPGLSISILNEAGMPLPAGETGTIHVDSPLISDGYVTGGDGSGFRRRGRLATVGDLGFLETDGTLHLLGRAGGMVLSGGNNVYPSEIEAVLSTLAPIRSAYVFGLDHPDLGQELAAVLEPAQAGLTAEALASALSGALPRYKHPRRIWLCRTMPATGSGKVAAKVLRQWIADGNDALERLS